MFFSKPGEYEPCGMFSVGHFILLVLALSIVGIALSNTKNISKEKVKEIIKKSTIVLWILEIIKIIFNFAIGNWKNPNNYIPLYYCSIILYAGLLSGWGKGALKKVGDVFVTIAAIILKIFLVALVIICCPVLFVLAVVIVALVFAVIAALVGGGALLYEMLPAIDWTPIATISPVMTLLGTISGIALIAIPLGAFLYTIMRQLFHWSPMGTGLKWSLFILWVLGLVIVIINLSALGWQLPLYGLHCF